MADVPEQTHPQPEPESAGGPLDTTVPLTEAQIEARLDKELTGKKSPVIRSVLREVWQSIGTPEYPYASKAFLDALQVLLRGFYGDHSTGLSHGDTEGAYGSGTGRGIRDTIIEELLVHPCRGRDWTVTPESDRQALYERMADLFTLVHMKKRLGTLTPQSPDALFHAIVADPNLRGHFVQGKEDHVFRGGGLSPLGKMVAHRLMLSALGDDELLSYYRR